MCEDPRVDGTCDHHDHDHDHDHGTAPLAAGEGRRMVVVGKGGVGKTTIAALLARQLARRKADVIAVDAGAVDAQVLAHGAQPCVAAAGSWSTIASGSS